MSSNVQKERKIVQYSNIELDDIEDDRAIIVAEIRKKKRNGTNIIYPNQEKCALDICNKFLIDKKIVNVLVYGKTQTGKTGCMSSIINLYVLTNSLPIENIYIITGLSDVSWKKDTKNRMPNSINNRVFHRANLNTDFVKDIRSKKNVLVIMDEIQIACKDKQTIHNTFTKCGFYDLNNLLENDIKLIQFSATPDGNINDIDDWKDYSFKIKLEPGENYIGTQHLLKKNRIKQYQDLININNVSELDDVIKSFEKPMYHLIRIPNKKNDKQDLVINNFKRIFKKNCLYNTDFLKIVKEDINSILTNKPEKHTFIFYCEILRCAKTQHKKYIGITYERYSKIIKDSTIIQGSVGRITGYDDNGLSICYTNLDTLNKYNILWNNNMIFPNGISWNTNTTKFKKSTNQTYSTGTFNSIKYIDDLKDDTINNKDKQELIIKKFNGEKGEQEGIKWFKNNKVFFTHIDKNGDVKTKNGPRITKKDDKGYYMRPLGKDKYRKDILSTERLYKHRKWNLDADPSKRRTIYTWFPCYEDVKDKKTLQWWLIFYKKIEHKN